MSPLASARETAFAGEVELTCPFRGGLVEALKEIPARYRSWDASEKTWRVREPHAQAAVDLLVAHFPNASVPEAYRIAPVVVTERPPAPDARIAAPVPAPRPAPDDLAPIVAVIACPTCGDRREQSVRVVTKTATAVARQERPPAEMASVCGRCRTLLIAAFLPALAPAAVLERTEPRPRKETAP